MEACQEITTKDYSTTTTLGMTTMEDTTAADTTVAGTSTDGDTTVAETTVADSTVAEITTDPTSQDVCAQLEEGKHTVPNPDDCHSFYFCVPSVNGGYTPYLHECQEHLAYDPDAHRYWDFFLLYCFIRRVFLQV